MPETTRDQMAVYLRTVEADPSQPQLVRTVAGIGAATLESGNVEDHVQKLRAVIDDPTRSVDHKISAISDGVILGLTIMPSL